MKKEVKYKILVRTYDAVRGRWSERGYADLDHLFFSLRKYQAKKILDKLKRLGISAGNHAETQERPYQNWNSSVEIPRTEEGCWEEHTVEKGYKPGGE